jgi:transketolase
MRSPVQTIATDDVTVTKPAFDNRDAFAETLVELARGDERIVAVCNDSVGSSKLVGFRAEFPDRLINVGIAEQNMIGVGAGLAASGLIPFVCGAAPFLTGRGLEQIKADVAYSQHAVILCGMSPGFAYGELGPTHHSIEDLSWLRPLPGLDIVVPADRQQTRRALQLVAADPRPTYIRVGRFPVPDVSDSGSPFERGRMITARGGSDATVVAVGTMVSRALAAAADLATEGIEVRVLDAAWIAPFDREAVVAAATETAGIVTAEEAVVSGGLGAAVTGIVAGLGADGRRPIVRLGIDGEFAPTGDTAFLLEHFGLTKDGIVTAVGEVLGRD